MMYMYVTTRPARIAGKRIPAGTIMPQGMRIPGHLVTSGIVVRLPDTLLDWPESDEEPETGSEAEAPDPEPEPEPEPEPDEEPELDISSINVDHLHVGGPMYELPNGQRVKGKDAARRALLDLRAEGADEEV